LDIAAVALLLYNESVLHFQMKQYETALVQLTALFRAIDAIDDWLAVRICCLLLEVFITHRHVDSAWDVVAQMEKIYTLLANKAAQQSTNPESPSSAGPAPQPTAEVPSTTAEKYPTPSAPVVNTAELMFTIHMYKARLHMMQRMHKLAKRELKAAQPAVDQQPIHVFLRANLEYLRQNWPKSVKLLNSCKKITNDASLPALYLNNMGCIHYRMQKYAAAGFYFARAANKNHEYVQRLRLAASSTTSPTTSSANTLYAFARDRSCEVLCNTGMTFIHANKPTLAFDCLQAGLGAYFHKPRVWLRLGEACIAQFVIDEKRNDEGLQSFLVRSEGGQGCYHRLRLRTTSHIYPAAPDALTSGPSICYAQICFRNALHLLTITEQQTASKTPSEATAANAVLEKAELAAMLQTALLGLAYASLAVGDGLTAFDACAKLLQLQLQPQSLFLAHVYTAEALIRLDRPYDAVEHLSPVLLCMLTSNES